MVIIRYEAYFLAFRSGGGGELHLLRDLFYLCLSQIADGEKRVLQLLLRKLAEKIRLVFTFILSFFQEIFAVIVFFNSGIMPGS